MVATLASRPTSSVGYMRTPAGLPGNRTDPGSGGVEFNGVLASGRAPSSGAPTRGGEATRRGQPAGGAGQARERGGLSARADRGRGHDDEQWHQNKRAGQ